ncbi:hypothetical protein CDA63_00885 [Hymenobacter amundsenii]|uniref:TonB C-terminal domain-containing protein n=1 Tax=Hymenobacter amundsenii TaxID=2006685 RepID=A0A246FT61_9BACT|nr:energy transducer TonB [Hymenobacter amundsenii]OWP64944.1 hypothetical protein CDA63_00885 [Hymenobacter amundsenii]
MSHYPSCWLLAASLAAAPFAAQAQAPATPSAFPAVYTHVQQMPVFPGGEVALFEALAARITYPEAALQQKLAGQVFVKFVVAPSGAVAEAEVVKGPHPLLNEAALVAVRALPAFEPGRQNGQPVPVAYTIPVKFRLPAPIAPAPTAYQLPQYNGGPEALRIYLSNQPLPAGYRPPAAATRPPRVFVSFVVDSTGTVSQVEAVQPLPLEDRRRLRQRPTVPAPDAALLAAAEARISAMPVWEPAQEQGRRVASTHTEPVTFGTAGPALAYADQMPVFPQSGGEMQHTGRQIRYPAAALRSQTQGEIALYYEVAEDGHLENLEVIRSVSPEIDAEALRVFRTNFPVYQPARHQDQPARVFYILPVTFRIVSSSK